jgi:N-acetylmuramoyl-L-alanine amidase
MPLSTSNADRLKRRLLHDLVQQNVDLIHNAPPRPRHRRLPRRRLAVVLGLLVLSSALAGSARLVSTLGATPRPGVAAAGAGALAAVATGSAPAASIVAAAAAPPGAQPLSIQQVDLAATPIDPAVLPLAVRKIAIDAGHGGDSHGTKTPFGLLEKDITLDIARRLQQLLEEQHSFEVVMTRHDDSSVNLAERAAIANRMGADIFVSVHVNWIEDRAARGVETYYLGPTNDPYLNRLAAAENRDSGYSMADMHQLLDRIYASVRQDKSRRLAAMVQGALYRSLGKVNPKVENRGVKSAPFIVLLSTQMPAILAEVSCLSNDEEARMLARPLYRQYIAAALADGLLAYASDSRGAAGGPGG